VKIIDRYLLREYLKPVFFCITGFTMIFIVWDLMGHISRFIDASTPLLLILKFYLFLLAPSLLLLVPASLLLATLYTLWSMTRTNQITAMRASGISLQRIMGPFILVAVMFSLLLLALNETYVPGMAMWAERFENNKYVLADKHLAKDVRFINGRAHRSW
jgi:lipopolysaccharide export system permease protein